MSAIDPPVKMGRKYKRFRVAFWEYFSVPMLESFVQALEKAQCFKGITRIEGQGRSRLGDQQHGFSWDRKSGLQLQANGSGSDSGEMVLYGKLDFTTINLVRNHPLFHMRGLQGAEAPRAWGIGRQS